MQSCRAQSIICFFLGFETWNIFGQFKQNLQLITKKEGVNKNKVMQEV